MLTRTTGNARAESTQDRAQKHQAPEKRRGLWKPSPGAQPASVTMAVSGILPVAGLLENENHLVGVGVSLARKLQSSKATSLVTTPTSQLLGPLQGT